MFAVDDELESSPKHEALDDLPPARRARAFEAWLRLGAACRKRGNGGLVTASLAAKILHTWKASERAETIADLVAAKGGRQSGLLVPDGDAWRFHEWEVWQPDEDEAAAERDSVSKKTLRQRRWRHRKRNSVDDEASTQASTERLHEPPTDVYCETSTERLHDVSRALRAPATRVRVPDPVPSLPIGGEANTPPPGETEPPETLLRDRVVRRWGVLHEAKRGTLPARDDRSARLVVTWLRANAPNVGRPEAELLEALLERYWRDPWPNVRANRPSLHNLVGQLDRLLIADRDVKPDSVSLEDHVARRKAETAANNRRIYGGGGS